MCHFDFWTFGFKLRLIKNCVSSYHFNLYTLPCFRFSISRCFVYIFSVVDMNEQYLYSNYLCILLTIFFVKIFYFWPKFSDTRIPWRKMWPLFDICRYVVSYICRTWRRSGPGCFSPWGQFIISPLGTKCDHRGEDGPPRVTFLSEGWSYPLGVKTLCLPLRSSKQ
jgi:hypothetical protein